MATALVNSDCGRKGELLGRAADLDDLLARYGWPTDESATQDDVRAVRELRPALRAVFTAASEEEARQRVNMLLLHARCVPQLARDSRGILRYEFVSYGPLVKRIECHAAGELAEALRTKGFERMRVCADETCTDVFVDSSRNQSRRFCRPETCGNRNNVAAYRSRRRRASAGARRRSR